MSCTKDMGFQPFCNGRRRYKWSKTTTSRRSRWIGEAWGILSLSRQLCSPTSTRSRGSMDGRCKANLKKWPQELEKRIQFSKRTCYLGNGTLRTSQNGDSEVVTGGDHGEGPDPEGAEGDHGNGRNISVPIIYLFARTVKYVFVLQEQIGTGKGFNAQHPSVCQWTSWDHLSKERIRS